jgi:hypothetical protein
LSQPVSFPSGAWPLEMRAPTAAAYCDEPSTDAFFSKVAKGEHPQPSRRGAIVTDPDGPMRGEFRIPKRPQRLPRSLVVADSAPKLVNSLQGASDWADNMMSSIVLDVKVIGKKPVGLAGPLWYEEGRG